MRRIDYNLTNEQKAQLIADFAEKLNTEKLNAASFNYSAKFDDGLQNEPKAKLFITAPAYLKMMLYVKDTDTEIAWHGTAVRTTANTTQLTAEFLIKDVFLYPQIVRSVTVDTDQEKYNQWVTELDDETFNNMRFQGHSHVNMGVTPSGVDTEYYNSILDTLKIEQPDSFYIFTVMNKRGEMYLIIYDLAKNIVYSKEDIEVIIFEGNRNVLKQISEQKEQYCEKPAPIYARANTAKTSALFDPDDPDNYYGMGEEERYDYILNKYAQKSTTKTDELFDDMDKKYKNLHLSANTKRNKRKK